MFKDLKCFGLVKEFEIMVRVVIPEFTEERSKYPESPSCRSRLGVPNEQIQCKLN